MIAANEHKFQNIRGHSYHSRLKFSAFSQAGLVAPDGLLQAQIEGVADQRMADGDLQQSRDVLLEIGQIFQAQVMAGVEFQTELTGKFGCCNKRRDGLLAVFGIVGGIRLGVQLDAVGADGFGRLDFGRIGFHEQRGADVVLLQPRDHFLQQRAMAQGVPAGVGSQHIRRVGHQRALRGPDFFHQPQKIFGRVAFDVEFNLDGGGDFVDIECADVAFVRAGVHGNAVSAERDAFLGGLQHIGIVAAAGIAQGGEFIDIYAQFGHARKVSNLPRKVKREEFSK